MLHVCISVPDKKSDDHEDALLFVNTEITQEQNAGWCHIWRWNGEVGQHAAHCVCCTGQGSLSAFLLARAQESVLGRCASYQSVWIICRKNEAERVQKRLQKEGFLNSFYKFVA